jgi:hypothetical protein
MGGSIMAVVINGTTGIDKVQDGSIQTADLAANAVTAAKLNVGQIGGRRNLIINGAMQVAQRGTSSAGLGGNLEGYHVIDRIKHLSGGTSAGRYTATQEAITDLAGFPTALKLACTTEDTSIAAGEFFGISHYFEGQNVQRIQKGYSTAKSLTLSFYVKGNASATYTAELKDTDNSRINGQTFNVTTSWTRVELTYPADTTGKLNNDNALSFALSLYLHAGSTYTGGTFTNGTWASEVQANRISSSNTSFYDNTNRTFFITGVQLEVGDTATPFEHHSYGEELALCQRYYLQQVIDIQTPIGGYMIVPIYFPTTMRAAPTTSAVAAGSTAGGFVSEGIGGLHTQGAYYQVQSSANSNYRLGRVDAYSAEL